MGLAVGPLHVTGQILVRLVKYWSYIGQILATNIIIVEFRKY